MVLDQATQRRFRSVGIERHNETNILLPQDMSLRDAARWLTSKDKELSEPYAVYERTDVHPLDGAYAFSRALAKRHGDIRTVVVPATFFSPAMPPTMIDVPLDAHGTSVKVPWGRFQLPGTDPAGWLECAVDLVDVDPVTDLGRPVFVLRGQMIKRDQDEVNEIARMMREILAGESIYKGKAIRVKAFDKSDGNPTHNAPTFIDVEGYTVDTVILNESIMSQVIDYVLTPIRYPQALRALHMPRKRGVLLHGTFGSGKTLLSRVIAHEATLQEMTFIYLEDASQLADGLRFAQAYAPSVLFVEDVDKVTSGVRDSEMDALLNILDGIDSKATEVITVFTTNEVQAIHRAFDRPGRIDVMIDVLPPDAKAASRLVQMYGGETLEADIDLTAVGVALEGDIPAVIAEAVSRARYSALARANGDHKVITVSADDILLAAESLESARRLLKRDAAPSKSGFEQIGQAAWDAAAVHAEGSTNGVHN